MKEVDRYPADERKIPMTTTRRLPILEPRTAAKGDAAHKRADTNEPNQPGTKTDEQGTMYSRIIYFRHGENALLVAETNNCIPYYLINVVGFFFSVV